VLMKASEVTKRRLIYIKRLLMHAQEHISHGTEFDKMVAVHHLDNVNELLLKCVAASYDISFKNPLKVDFPTLWRRVNEEYKEGQGSELPNKTQVFYIHRIRTDVQHWGRTPFSLDSVKEFDEQTHGFVQTILNTVYGLKYEELSLSSLIKDKKIRAPLNEAEKYIANEEWKEAITKVSVAFAHAEAKAQKKRYLPTVPIIRIGLEDVDERVGILALGLDIEEYKRFKKSTPVVMFPLREEPVIQWIGEFDFTRESTLFCFNFALNSILRWDL